MIWFARHLLPAVAVHATGDPDLPDGLHLRIMPSTSLGLPITPFLIYPLRTRGRAWRQFEDDADGTRRIALPEDIPSGSAVVAAEAHGGNLSRGWLATMHRDGLRVVARRSVAPLAVAATRLDQLRAAPSTGYIDFYTVQPADLEKLVTADPSYPPMGLPVAGDLAWYAGGTGRDAAVERVKLGAPRRLTPVDRPDGALGSLSPGDDWDRIAESSTELDGLLDAMLAQDAQSPGDVLVTHSGADEDNVPQSMSSLALTDVLLRAIDPGVARYLGLATCLKPFASRRETLPALGAVALFALSGSVVKQLASFGAVPPEAGADDYVIERFMRLYPEVKRVIERARSLGMWVGAVSTVAAAPPPPEKPVIPALTPQLGRWISNGGDGAFAQGLVITRPPLAPLVAVARREGEGWVSRHDPETTSRRRLRLVGTRVDPGSSGETQGIVFDQPIPAKTLPRYRLRLGDLFGRYGAEVECDSIAPPRPAPPTPVPQISIRRSIAVLPATGDVSPGTLQIRLPVPEVDDLALGALPIERADILFGDEAHPQNVTGPLIKLTLALPPLAPMASVELPLTIRFVDAAGAISEPFIGLERVADSRAPHPIPYGYGLIWTSRPGPAHDVQVALRWPAPSGQQHRAYIADAAGLGLSGTTRAAVADAGVTLALNGQSTGSEVRKTFRLLTDVPVTAVDGWATLRAILPRALQTVQFVRIVPIRADGVEADFDACGLIPIAVPTDRAPPPPRLRALPSDDARTLTLRIEAVGLNLKLLERQEPGLFANPPAGGARPLEFRIRRASGAVPDPIYAREILAGSLIRKGAGDSTQFTAVVVDDGNGAGLVPYMHYTYWAEVRMPAERRALAAELPVAGAAEGLSPAQMADCPGIWSAVSAPITIVNAPATLPAAPLATDVDAVLSRARMPFAEAVHLTVRNAPTDGGWELRVWRSWGGGPLEQVKPDIAIDGSEVRWSETSPLAHSAVAIAIAFVDPLDRQGAIFMPVIATRLWRFGPFR